MTAQPPRRIAHAYGNRHHQLQRALPAAVDMIEADLWYQGDNIWVRHERRLPFLPVLYGRRSVGARGPGPRALPLGCRWYATLDLHPMPLEELIQQVGDKGELLLDLKGGYSAADGQRFVDRLVVCLRRFAVEARAHLCGSWPLLDRVRRCAPELRVCYSVGHLGQWEALVRRLEEGERIEAICIHRHLLNEERARWLHDRGIEFYCWPVDEADEALRLMGLGVDGIISYDLELLGSLAALAARCEFDRPGPPSTAIP